MNDTEQQPLESQLYPGYFVIPNFSQYVISRTGDVINVVTGNHISRTDVMGYNTVALWDDYGHHKMCRLGRLLLLTFRPREDSRYLVVDHVNCKKNDDRLENLEWVTGTENSRRAGVNGLMGTRLPVEVRDWDTKEVVVYPSRLEASKANNLTDSAIKYRLHCRDGRVFPERKQYRYLNEPVDWSEKEDIESTIARYGRVKAVYLKDLKSGSVTEFEKLSDLAKSLKMPLPSLSTYMAKSDNNQPVLPGLYQVKMKSDPRPWVEYQDPWIELSKYTGLSPVQVLHVDTGEKEIFESQVACAKAKGLLTSTLNNRLKLRPNTTVYRDGCRYGYYPFD